MMLEYRPKEGWYRYWPLHTQQQQAAAGRFSGSVAVEEEALC
jgi:hypothetical protein